MKTILVSARSRTINELLEKARRGTVVLESANGQRFALTLIDDWESFDVGSGRGLIGALCRIYRRLTRSVAVDVYTPYLQFCRGQRTYDHTVRADFGQSGLPFRSKSCEKSPAFSRSVGITEVAVPDRLS